jgi:hypothetical protein
MVTDNEHIDALRARLSNRLLEIENEATEVREMIRVLGEAPKLLGKSVVTPAPIEGVAKTTGRTLSNRNVTQLVRDYIDSYGVEQPLEVPEIVKWLFEHGVKGKQRSINAAVHVILKKETGPGKDGRPPRLTYEKGIGFFKHKREPP